MSNDWRKGAIEVGNGQLALNLKPGPKGSDDGTSDERRSADACDFMRYGDFEVRARACRRPGTVSGVFTDADRAKGVKPNEIDTSSFSARTRGLWN